MIRAAIAAGLALAAVACAPSTPDARIARDPARFEALPADQQTAAREGRITKGMAPDAVYFAWGRASNEFVGSEDGLATRRWDYVGSQPVYSNTFSAGYGYGLYGRYGRYYGSPYFYDFGPAVSYVPYRRASVWFENDRVVKWERQNRR